MLDQLVVFPSVCVVFGKDFERFILFALAHEVSWAFGDIEKESNDNDRSSELKQGRESPRPRSGDIETTETDPGGKKTSNVGKGVVGRSEVSA